MSRYLLAFSLLLPSLASANAIMDVPGGVASCFRRNPAFLPIGLRAANGQGRVEQVGEVVIIEGDDFSVTVNENGGFGIDPLAGQPMEITKRFYEKYPDEFDTIVVFTTFRDEAAQGASAYEISAQNDATGIGRPKFDRTAEWGATKHKLFAFVNMMEWDQFGAGGDPTLPNSYLHNVLGQEFAHRWLSFMRYTDRNGVISTAMLGRDQSHWASTLQAYGSVLDGNMFVDTMDGWYQTTGSNYTFSPLDLYGMGLMAAEDVPPFWVIHNAVTSNGNKVNPASPLRRMAKIQGDREDITIQQVIAAEGPRLPSAAESMKNFRVAFLLVTKPGETADQVVSIAEQIEKVRQIWEWRFGLMTEQRGKMCTQVSAPCGAPSARVMGGEVVEAGGNRNGTPEPGEQVFVRFDIRNDSVADAPSVTVHAKGDVVGGSVQTELDALPAATTKPATFLGAIPAEAQCGQPLTISAEAVVEGHTFRGFTRVVPGLAIRFQEGFESTQGPFAVNRLGGDTTTKNGWEYGTPTMYASRFGWVYQPGAGHASQKAWFTGLQGGTSTDRDSSLAIGRSTLTSLPIDARGTYKPSIHYWAWYQSIEYANPMQGGQIIDSAPMLLEASADGGRTWVEIDRIEGGDSKWLERNAPLDALKVDDTVILRFTVENTSANILIEAGVDDVELRTLSSGCNPDAPPPDATPAPKAGGCDMSGGPAPAGALLLAGLLLVAQALRRRD